MLKSVRHLHRAQADITTSLPKPRVLLADDHPQMLEFIAKELSAEFDVVAMVSDGHRAVEASRRLDPDIVILDISLPDLDGFQTARTLTRIGSRAKVVFLTLHDADEYIVEAIGCGASGYVLKTRIRSHLATALHHARAGHVFLPTVSPLALADGPAHVVQFSGHEQRFVESAARFLNTALVHGDAIGTNVTESNRHGIRQQLDAQGWDLAQLERQGRYLEFSPDDAVSRVVRNGRADVEYLTEIAARCERARLACNGGTGSRFTLIASVASLLCSMGHFGAALEMERTWHDLTHNRALLTLCPYPLEFLGADAPPGIAEKICAHHNVVSPPDEA